MTEINQNSKPISQLEREIPSNDDIMLIERDVNGISKSFGITYGDIKKLVIQKLKDTKYIGSMCYFDKENFSEFAHGHNYSDFYFYPSFGPDGKIQEYKKEESVLNCGYFDIIKYGMGKNKSRTDRIQVCIPKKTSESESIQPTKYLEYHEVGEIEMLAVNGFRYYLENIRGYLLKDYNGYENIDIKDHMFDGFVIPNGTTFTCQPNEFTTACTYFSDKKIPSATSFTVPDLTHFFRCSNGINYGNEGAKEIPYHNGIASHNHNQSIQGNESQCIDRIPSKYATMILNRGFHQNAGYPMTDTTEYGSLYGGSTIQKCNGDDCGVSEFTPYSIQFSNCKVTDAVVKNSSSEQDIESYPEHMTVPVLLYIGRK